MLPPIGNISLLGHCHGLQGVTLTTVSIKIYYLNKRVTYYESVFHDEPNNAIVNPYKNLKYLRSKLKRFGLISEKRKHAAIKNRD